MSYDQGKGLCDDVEPSVTPSRFDQWLTGSLELDGTTLLPTFMPVATQAAIKGLTAQQVEALGITLMLNNTYHLNLRPGTKVLDAVGGAHKFQGWRRNLLTVSFISAVPIIHNQAH